MERDSRTPKGGKDKSKKDSHHFDEEQMRGLSAVGSHLMEQAERLIEAKMGKTINNYDVFDQQPPQAPVGTPPNTHAAYTSVFRRMQTQSERDPRPDAKRRRFMDQLGKYE